MVLCSILFSLSGRKFKVAVFGGSSLLRRSVGVCLGALCNHCDLAAEDVDFIAPGKVRVSGAVAVCIEPCSSLSLIPPIPPAQAGAAREQLEALSVELDSMRARHDEAVARSERAAHEQLREAAARQQRHVSVRAGGARGTGGAARREVVGAGGAARKKKGSRGAVREGRRPEGAVGEGKRAGGAIGEGRRAGGAARAEREAGSFSCASCKHPMAWCVVITVRRASWFIQMWWFG
eukprot:356565-Chlamydomonas_euryale.AAC.4